MALTTGCGFCGRGTAIVVQVVIVVIAVLLNRAWSELVESA